MTHKKRLPKVQRKKAERPSMHYSVMIALVISNVTSLGLAFLMAQLMGMSMANIAQIGESQKVAKAYAQVYSERIGTKGLPSSVTPLPGPVTDCEGAWASCSAVCDETYTEGHATKVGWNACERDCDLKFLYCDKNGTWNDKVPLKDTTFRPTN